MTIHETTPMGILFKNKTKYILDNESNLVIFDKNLNFDSLPNIFGKGAEENFLYFSKILDDNNFPRYLVTKFYYFQAGRWDVHLTNGKIIKYPSDEVKLAISKSIELLNREDFTNYKIIDLRVAGKIIVE